MYVIGASLIEPHIDDVNVREIQCIYMHNYMYVWYVRYQRAAIRIVIVQQCAVYSRSAMFVGKPLAIRTFIAHVRVPAFTKSATR